MSRLTPLDKAPGLILLPFRAVCFALIVRTKVEAGLRVGPQENRRRGA